MLIAGLIRSTSAVSLSFHGLPTGSYPLTDAVFVMSALMTPATLTVTT